MRICIKRVYEAASPDDGERILVDRLWPRGLSKEKAAIDIWEKDVAPSAALRKWFGHDPDKFDDFRNKYRKELEDNPATKRLEDMIHHLGKDKKVTLLFSAKDEIHNQAAVLNKNPIRIILIIRPKRTNAVFLTFVLQIHFDSV